MNAILIGYGEVGKGIYGVFAPHHNIDLYDVNGYINKKHCKIYDVMLICIPYSKDFIKIVKDYQKQFNPKATVIFSTVAIGTTSQIENAVHSPIEGKHNDKTIHMADYLKEWKFLMGGYNETVNEFSKEAGNFAYIVKKPEHTEALKLLSTTFYGVMIEYTRYAKQVCDDIDMNFNDYKGYNLCYNALYKALGGGKYTRPILDPPEGKIGGHCVVPNAKILNEQYPNELVEQVIKWNS
ncbi:MAG: hypothetical protein JRI72_00145 [Deltaproteobacteria bacterium]|nr:hypothetical protein [Deltaproteobacteria bacterium]